MDIAFSLTASPFLRYSFRSSIIESVTEDIQGFCLWTVFSGMQSAAAPRMTKFISSNSSSIFRGADPDAMSDLNCPIKSPHTWSFRSAAHSNFFLESCRRFGIRSNSKASVSSVADSVVVKELTATDQCLPLPMPTTDTGDTIPLHIASIQRFRIRKSDGAITVRAAGPVRRSALRWAR